MKATEGNGGAPIVLGKDPVEKPEIIRGAVIIWMELLDGPAVAGGVVSFSITRGGFRITTHDCRVTAVADGTVYLDVGPETVVTWERVGG